MNADAAHRREARRLRLRVTSMLEVELRPGTPGRDQIEALARDLELPVDLVLLAHLVVQRAALMLDRLDELPVVPHDDDPLEDGWPPDVWWGLGEEAA